MSMTVPTPDVTSRLVENKSKRIVAGVIMAIVAAVAATLALVYSTYIFVGFLLLLAALCMTELFAIWQFNRNDDSGRTSALFWQTAIVVIGTVGAIIVTIFVDFGIWIVVGIAALALVENIAAMYGGKKYGNRFNRFDQLAPKYSPNKTWTGFAHGCVWTIFLGLVVFFSLRAVGQSMLSIFFLIGSLFVPLIAEFGDWVESRTKRLNNGLKAVQDGGIKDSGELLREWRGPIGAIERSLSGNHGGFLDRLDSVMAAWAGMTVLCLVSYGFTAGAISIIVYTMSR